MSKGYGQIKPVYESICGKIAQSYRKMPTKGHLGCTFECWGIDL